MAAVARIGHLLPPLLPPLLVQLALPLRLHSCAMGKGMLLLLLLLPRIHQVIGIQLLRLHALMMDLLVRSRLLLVRRLLRVV